MDHILKLTRFVRPYWKPAAYSLILLALVLVMDLSIPRLIERLIDQGINAHDQSVVLQTSLVMLGISLLSAVMAIANSVFSVRVGENVARDLRDALFTK